MNSTTSIVVEKMIKYFGDDVLRINHALKVYGFAYCIARNEKLSDNDIFIVDIVALLHDIGIVEAERKYNSSNGTYQEIEGPAVALNLLSSEIIDDKTLERICFIIGNHHSYLKIDRLDFQVIVEADFLVNIYEEEMSKHSIESVRDKYFKTKTGISILESIYLNQAK